MQRFDITYTVTGTIHETYEADTKAAAEAYAATKRDYLSGSAIVQGIEVDFSTSAVTVAPRPAQ